MSHRKTLFPTAADRASSISRIAEYSRQMFETEEDFFYFTHIDPNLRFWHALGFAVGLPLFGISIGMMVFGMPFYAALLWGAGILFFYGFGWISHSLYDGGYGRTVKFSYWQSIIWVVKINMQTLLGTYDKGLNQFICKYPFVVEAWELDKKALLNKPQATIMATKS